MAPKRAIKKKAIRSQTFMHPYQFRPVAISLAPADIEIDMEIMNTLLVAQRAAVQRASQEHAAAAAAASESVHPYASDAAAGATSEDEHDGRQRAPATHFQQQYASPSCTFQHQQAFGRQPLAGYAVA